MNICSLRKNISSANCRIEDVSARAAHVVKSIAEKALQTSSLSAQLREQQARHTALSTELGNCDVQITNASLQATVRWQFSMRCWLENRRMDDVLLCCCTGKILAK